MTEYERLLEAYHILVKYEPVDLSIMPEDESMELTYQVSIEDELQLERLGWYQTGDVLIWERRE